MEALQYVLLRRYFQRMALKTFSAEFDFWYALDDALYQHVICGFESWRVVPT